jgi:outer membrane protein OmpA-like peptidoglycan-associated protein
MRIERSKRGCSAFLFINKVKLSNKVLHFKKPSKIEKGAEMIQQELNQENKEIRSIAYTLYEKHGFKDGNEFVDWLEAERQTGKKSRLIRRKQFQNILFVIIALLCIIVAILMYMLFRNNPTMELSDKNLSDLKGMMLVLDPRPDEKVLIFGDTHFDYDQSVLNPDAQAILAKNIQLLKENPDTRVRMAGYTSAKGSEEINQKLSEERANAVRDYLVKNGIAPERLTVIGYGRTKPAFYEASPKDVDTKEAKANMRVLFEVVVK